MVGGLRPRYRRSNGRDAQWGTPARTGPLWTIVRAALGAAALAIARAWMQAAGVAQAAFSTSAIVVPRRASVASRSFRSLGLVAATSASATVTRPATTCA